ncbi:MAG: histidine phosphatase family protein [Halopseudomonas sp.]
MSQRLIIDLLRHGACDDGKIYRGRTDSALSTVGWAQMDAATRSDQLTWQAIYSSPLQRCRLPAQRLAERLGLPLQLDDRLREIDFGDWDGLLQLQVWQQHPSQVLAFWQDPETNPPPSAESIHSLQQRVAEMLQCWLAGSANDASERHLLCVCHGGVIRTLLCQLLGMPVVAGHQLSLDYGSFSRIELYRDRDADMPQQLGFHSQVIFINRLPELDNYEDSAR